MPYENIPHVGVIYNDGSFKEPPTTTQPRILALGSATSGLTNELFSISNVREAETEFGASSDVMRSIHETLPQGAENLAIMRVGGRQGNLVLTDSDSDTLTITPEFRDDTIMTRYALAMDETSTGSGVQRIGVFDLTDETWVFDSEEILVINEGIVEVVDAGLALFSTGTFTDPTTMTAMSALVTGDFTPIGVPTMTSVVATQGTDGTDVTLVEKYAALNTAYHLLDFKDADLVTPARVYVDDDNVVDGDSLNLWAGPPLDGESDALGYLWQYIYQGKLYTYFTDSDTYFTDVGSNVASTCTPAVATTLVITATKAGDADGKFSIETTGGGTSPIGISDVTITETAGVIAIVADIEPGTSTTAEAASAINLALAAFTMSNDNLASGVLSAAGDATVIAGAEAAVLSSGGSGPFAATHDELTGDTVPAAVTARFALAVTNTADVELRECNFGHQLASFCELASTVWKTMIGSISFKEPPVGFSREQIATWVGELPTYTTIGSELAIDAPADNGTGLLGFKFLAGFSATSDGYRNQRVLSGNSTDGLAFGGFIKTQGLSLPNGVDFPYGIEDSDELEDVNNAPVDLGKHLLVTYDWPVHRNAFDGGTPYRGSLEATLLGKLATIPENEEPIGENGLVLRVTSPPRIHSTQLDSLALIRGIGLRFEEGVGFIFVAVKTASHPDSDYIRISTIRSVNRELQGIRDISKKFIGKPFSPQRLVSLQSQIDGFLQAERAAGFNQGAVASLNYTRSDRILGKLEIRLRMVPPFSIERIDITTTLAADESEL